MYLLFLGIVFITDTIIIILIIVVAVIIIVIVGVSVGVHGVVVDVRGIAVVQLKIRQTETSEPPISYMIYMYSDGVVRWSSTCTYLIFLVGTCNIV
jgi:hypothetical protein